MVVVIPSGSRSDVIISNNYPVSVENISPSIVYNNSSNFPPLWSTNLNIPKTQAYTNITSIWSSDIYCDDNGNVFWTDTYGNVFVNWTSNGEMVSLGTPYSYFAYAGPITSIAAVNYTTFSGTTISYVVLLTYYGYVFGHKLNKGKWFNATKQWSLPLTNYPSPWTSVTSNVKGFKNGYDEGFFFTDLSGDVYFYDITKKSNSEWVVQNSLNKNI
ncbi:MAG: hypothetical protein ACP5RY_07045, partial [Thermoplasmata archaeon]